jgi:hypothetical protein
LNWASDAKKMAFPVGLQKELDLDGNLPANPAPDYM